MVLCSRVEDDSTKEEHVMVFVDREGTELHPGDYITWISKKHG